MALIFKYLIVYALSAAKIIFGPTLGHAYGFSIIETVLLSLAGMMTSVYLFSYFGPQIRAFTIRIFGSKKPKPQSKTKQRFLKIWKRYGVAGIAFLTPILLSPPGGTIMANAFGGKRSEIIRWMWVFGTFWSITLTLLVNYAASLLEKLGLI